MEVHQKTEESIVNANKNQSIDQDHSTYTSYPSAKPLRNFRNLNETFNSHIQIASKNIKSTEVSQYRQEYSTDDSNNLTATRTREKPEAAFGFESI